MIINKTVNRRKSNFITYIQRLHKVNGNQEVWQLGLICHSELRTRIKCWGFKELESNSQGNKKSRCSVLRCLSCHTGHSDKKLFLFLGQDPYLNVLGSRGRDTSFSSVCWAWLSSVKNSLHAKVAHFGKAHSDPLQSLSTTGHGPLSVMS